MSKRTPRKWHYKRGDNYWYWEDAKAGLGHVIRHDKSYDASTMSKAKSFDRLWKAKKFVERNT